MYPNSNDDTFLERLFSHYGDREHQALIRKSTGIKQFILQHLQGTNPVLYCAHGWLKHSREHPAVRNASTLLQDSCKEEINRLYVGSLTRSSGGIVFCGSIAGLEGTQSLRRVSSIRRSFTSAGVKRNSIMLQVKFTVDGIIDTLRRTGTHFVHCYLLQHHAGLQSNVSTSGSPNCSFQTNNEDMVNVPLLRSQVSTRFYQNFVSTKNNMHCSFVVRNCLKRQDFIVWVFPNQFLCRNLCADLVY